LGGRQAHHWLCWAPKLLLHVNLLLLLWMLLLRKLLLVLLVVGELNLHILHWHLRLRWWSNFHICENSIDQLDISPVVRHEETAIRMAAGNHRLMSDHGINCAGIAWRSRMAARNHRLVSNHGINCAGIAWRSRGARLSGSILVTIHNTAPKTLIWIVHRLSGGALLP